MADLTPGATGAASSERAGFAAGAVAVAVILGIVAVGLARIAAGWSPLAPDDARYLFVGFSVLDGRGAITPSGDPYLLRSPIYGMALALGSRALGGDPLDGGHLVAAGAGLLGLVGALRVAWLAAGPGAAVGAAVALAATPIVWSLLPSLRIDLTQTALVVALVLFAWRPTTRRWAAAGVVLGLIVLVKETALPLVLLPVAMLRTVPAPAWRRIAVAYLAAALLSAGWWWVVVYVASGQVFPLDGLAVVEARDVGGSLRLPWLAAPLAVAALIGWAVVAWRARSDPGPRLLVVTAIGLAPAAAYAAAQGLNARNFAGLAVLSAIAIGIAGATLAAQARAWAGHDVRRLRVGAPLIIAALATFAVAGPFIGQWSVPRPGSDRLTDDLVAWVADQVPDGGTIVMPFREREAVALRRFGRTEVRLLGVARVDAADDPASYLWMGLRDAQLFGYARWTWEATLTEPAPDFLIMVSPHPFTPVELVGAGSDGSGIPGLTQVATLEADGDRAAILRVDPVEVATGTPGVPLHLSAAAALAWLDMAAGPDGDDAAVARLLAARPVVSGTAIPALLERLGDRACVIPGPAGSMELAPAPTCPA